MISTIDQGRPIRVKFRKCHCFASFPPHKIEADEHHASAYVHVHMISVFYMFINM